MTTITTTAAPSMLAATPLSEWLAKQFGHRIACLGGSLLGLSWAVDHGYAAIAACMVVMTVGLRTVMTICAVALVEAMPSNRTPRSARRSTTPLRRSAPASARLSSGP